MKQQLIAHLQESTTGKQGRDLSELYEYLAHHLSDIYRRSGESYFQHGCEVALTVQETEVKSELVFAALAHDLLVHPQGDTLLQQAPLTDSQRSLVQGMHALRRLHIDEDTKDLDLTLQTFLSDGRLVFLRMAHRLNDVRHLDRFQGQLRKNIAQESLHMYTAIAGRLGLHRWRREMEDACFRELHPKQFRQIQELSEKFRPIDELCIQHTEAYLYEKLQEQQLPVRIVSRRKSLYSSYRKMVLKNRRYEDLHDRIALRLILPDREQCYLALGIIHQWMHPIPGKLKDYIGAPKENGYRSIHTVVYPLPGVNERPIEIQIRSEVMDHECEWGIAAHSRYKISRYLWKKPIARVNLFQNLQHLRSQVRSPQQFEQALRTYFREDHLSVFDPEDNLYHLQQPANALDAALLIYGNKCRRIRKLLINGKESDLASTVHNGDVIEVQLSKKISFQKSWVHCCLHKASKNQIRSWL